MLSDQSTHAVDPARFASGEYCHRSEKTIGEGDIAASYSADRIGMGQPVRKPFTWHGVLWVKVGGVHRGKQAIAAEAYRLAHPATFNGQPVTYAEKTRFCAAARADQNGFYHGMRVKHGAAEFVLCGPPVTFVPGQTEQLSLF